MNPGDLTSPSVRRAALAEYLLVAVLTAGMFYLLYSLGDKEMQGFRRDDGNYLITAKALAGGEGYRHINLPGSPLQNKYPILYPLFLSAGWRLNSSFPDNIPLLLLLSTGLAASAFPLIYFFLRRIKKLNLYYTLLICSAFATNYYYLYSASALLSEGMFFLLSISTLYVAEKISASPQTLLSGRFFPGPPLLALIILAAAAFHARTAGVALLAGIGVLLLLKRRIAAAAWFVFCTAALSILPWQLWVSFARDANGDMFRSDALTSLLFVQYIDYTRELAQQPVFHDFSLARLAENFSSNINNLVFNVADLLAPTLSRAAIMLQASLKYILHPLLCCTVFIIGVLRSKRRGMSATGLYVLFSIAVILAWCQSGHQPRFLCVLLPLLLLPPCAALQEWERTARTRSSFALRRCAVTAGFVLAVLPANVKGIQGIHAIRTQHILTINPPAPIWDDYKAIFAQLQTIPSQDAVIGARFDQVVFLYTGKKTSPFFYPKGLPFDGSSVAALIGLLNEQAITHVLADPEFFSFIISYPRSIALELLLQNCPRRLSLLYAAPNGQAALYAYARTLPCI